MIFALFKSLFGRGESPQEKEKEPPLSSLDDAALMQRYAAGDDRAFALLVERHQRGLYNFILRSCGRRDVADELLQEVFLKVIGGAASYEASAKFTTWIYRIARNTCIDAARKRSRADLYSLQNPIGDESGETHQDRLADSDASSASVDHDRRVFLDRLQGALEQLPEEQREVFTLREITGLKFREIAEVLDIPEPTVKSRMRYALQFLRGELAEFKDHSFDEEEEMEMVP